MIKHGRQTDSEKNDLSHNQYRKKNDEFKNNHNVRQFMQFRIDNPAKQKHSPSYCRCQA